VVREAYQSLKVHVIRIISLIPGLFTPVFVAFSTNVREHLINTCGGVAHFKENCK